MTPQELLITHSEQIKIRKLIKDQENMLMDEKIKISNNLKTKFENDYAQFIVKRDGDKWFLENLKDKFRINLNIGDRIEFIVFDEIVSIGTVYKSVTENLIIELGNYIRVSTSNGYAFVFGEGKKIFGINNNMNSENEDCSRGIK